VRSLLIATVLLACSAAAQPINSDLADARAGGGCYPTGYTPSVLDMLVLINPEWAPIVNGTTIDSDPVLVSGTVERIHGQTGGDFPSTHALSDVVMDVIVDPEHENKVATGNDEPHEIAFEWEVGKYPDWAWPGFEDRIYGLGRHIFDCGHPGAAPGHCSVTTARPCVLDGDCRPPVCNSGCQPTETCEGEHFGYSSEIHPPHATAVIRQGRGAFLSKKATAKPVPATIADVWVSPDGGGAGDRCVLTHQASEVTQLVTQCWPLAEPVAKLNAADFTFNVPLPPRPAGPVASRWRLFPPPTSGDTTDVPGGRRARLKVKKRLHDPIPSLDVTVRMTRRTNGQLPTGFAGRFVAGWNVKAAPLTHVRVTVSAILVANDLMRAAPLVPRTCEIAGTPCDTAADCPAGEHCWGEGPVHGWGGQVAVNGEWRRFSGSDLDTVADGDVIGQAITYDQYLAPDGELRVQADAFSRECINTRYGQSLASGLDRLGLQKGIICIGADESHSGGAIDEMYAAPDFGSGPFGTQTYETESSGGEGGHCSVTTSTLCVVDDDCPGETCTTTGGAFRLRYTIEKVP
jgi:hypothetical protein